MRKHLASDLFEKINRNAFQLQEVPYTFDTLLLELIALSRVKMRKFG